MLNNVELLSVKFKKIIMKRVTGLGGVFIKSNDPKALAAWYEKHLGINFGNSTYFVFPNADEGKPIPGFNLISFSKSDTDYFNPSKKDTMINFRVDDLFSLIDQLRKEGVEIAGDPIAEEYGKFGWVMDPDGNKIELWQPPDEK